ncbi:hypothetical protein GTQ34_08700 [Muricauda sp. JGD-17]|uniref:Uncharacterized protein n=1 Tax=Flagellimonas ochracea TaxID=2696472 RepID=A0A964TEI0_9FLAO|nr:hypothetical protein [Allomuricauda ochracea]NAY91996.1 hypothetical protein [Allomuricauda ochracea]
MAEKITQDSRFSLTREKTKNSERYYPIYFTLMGFMFAIILMMSALNNYLFFGWLLISMAIVLGLMFIHLMGKSQVKRS